MGSQAFTYALLVYFVIVALFVGILGQGGALADSDIIITTNPSINSGSSTTFSYQYSETLLPGVPVCSINGSLVATDPSVGIVKFRNDSITLSSECTTYCTEIGHTTWWLTGTTVYEMDCSGICVNATTTSGTNTQTCSPQKSNDYNFVTSILGFFAFGMDLGLGAWMWIVRIIFVYVPLLFLVLSIAYGLRGT